MKWLDGLIAGRRYIAGDQLTMADILLFAFLDFFDRVGQPIDPELANIGAWYARMKERPSASA